MKLNLFTVTNEQALACVKRESELLDSYNNATRPDTKLIAKKTLDIFYRNELALLEFGYAVQESVEREISSLEISQNLEQS